MKYIKHIFLITIAITTIIACSEDDPFTNPNVAPPSNLQLILESSATEVGQVKITPTAESVSYFEIGFGDGTFSDQIAIGQSVTHQYTEGTFTVTGKAFNLVGDSTTTTETLTVMFDPPSDLNIDISIDAINTNVVTVTPTATNAMMYDIYFGDVTDEVATVITDGSSATHSYTEDGSYDIRVVAKSGSTTTIEKTETVIIVVPAEQLSLPLDFESNDLDYNWISFGNATLTIEDNPDMDGNTSNKVVKFHKAAGAEVWAGGVIELPTPIDFSSETNMTMDIWTPKSPITVLIKLENLADNTIFHEVMVTTTTTDSWENLSFDFSAIDQSNTYQKIVVFIDFGEVGDDTNYYLDNITLGEGGGTGGGGDTDPITLPIDFESSNVDYVFESFGNASADVIDNPDSNGENTSSKVGHLNKAAGAEVWAGTFIDVADPIDFADGTTFTMSSWSPKSDAIILIKIENSSDSEIFLEVETTTTISDGWETITADFSGIDLGQSYDRIVIFYDFSVQGEGSDYYFDNIRFE